MSVWVPVPDDPRGLTAGRALDGNKPWSAGAGASALAAGLTETLAPATGPRPHRPANSDRDNLSSSSWASCRDVIDAPLQRARQDACHLGDQRSQFVRSVAWGQHDDDRERQVVLILLMREPAVYGEQRIESAIRGEAEERAVSGARPSRLRDSSNLESGWKGRP